MIRKLVALIALAGSPLTASAVPSGVAWDSVTKLAINVDASTLQPGSFDADYAAAAQAPAQAPVAGIQGLQQMVKTGLAQRHYLAGSKERIDDVAQQTATIVDCDARTITTLDLRGKTYRVVSMDQPAAQNSGPGGGPLSSFLKNGTKIAISTTNTALGTLVVGGQPSNGFRSQMTMTQTSTSGESHTVNAVRVAYYSDYRNPSSTCSGVALAASLGPRMIGVYDQIMSALSSGGTNLQFSLNQNGPLLPVGRVAMYEAMTFGMQGHGATITIERGNIRPVSTDDPVFSIPPGFTKQQ